MSNTGKNTSKKMSLAYDRLQSEVKENKQMTYIAPEKWKNETPTNSKLVKILSRHEPTDGSCSSVAFAYAGNRAGYMVEDFKGGESENYFADMNTILGISRLRDVESKTIWKKNDFEATEELLESVQEGKEYYLATGKHAAIVTRYKGKPYFLELQSDDGRWKNGYHILTKKNLGWRFGCKDNHKGDPDGDTWPNTLISVDSLCNSKEFIKMLGYINTRGE